MLRETTGAAGSLLCESNRVPYCRGDRLQPGHVAHDLAPSRAAGGDFVRAHSGPNASPALTRMRPARWASAARNRGHWKPANGLICDMGYRVAGELSIGSASTRLHAASGRGR